jgi:hypothetical protein
VDDLVIDVTTLATGTPNILAQLLGKGVSLAWPSEKYSWRLSTVPRTFTDFALISPRMRACSPIVSVPIVPSTSQSMTSSFRNLTKPLIKTPRERKAPDCAWLKFSNQGSNAMIVQ